MLGFTAHGRSPGSRSSRTLAFPVRRESQPVAYRASVTAYSCGGSLGLAAKAAHRIPCYRLAATVDRLNMPLPMPAVNRDI